MSCIHSIWNCYCKLKEEICDKPCSLLCKDYCTEETITMINNVEYYKPTAATDYVSLLECFMNTLYDSKNYNVGFFGLDAYSAEARAEEDMLYLGFTEDEIKDAYVLACARFETDYLSVKIRLQQFLDRIFALQKQKKNEYSTEYRFVLTLILGYLGQLNTIDIISCREPEIYFKSKVDHVMAFDLIKAINKTRAYVKESKDAKLAEGLRKFEMWIDNNMDSGAC